MNKKSINQSINQRNSQQHYKSKSFPTNPKAKLNILLSTFDVQSQIYFSTEI